MRRLESIGVHGGRFRPPEAALWDVLGKVAGLPVATLFGGVADRPPVYASWCSEQPPARRAEDAAQLVEEGFRAVKIRAHPRRLDGGVATVAAVRAAVGDRLDVMVDLNQAWRMPGDVTEPLALATTRPGSAPCSPEGRPPAVHHPPTRSRPCPPAGTSDPRRDLPIVPVRGCGYATHPARDPSLRA